jgi:hypothetical protein
VYSTLFVVRLDGRAWGDLNEAVDVAEAAYLHAARIIRIWHVHLTTGAARRLSVRLGHVTGRLSVGLGRVISWLRVGLGPIAFGLRIFPWKHDVLVLHVRATGGRSEIAP